MRHTTITCATIAAFVLGACAQQEEPADPVIQGQPIYNKFGSEIIGCEEGVYIPGAAPQEQCLPPDDDCDPTFDSTGQQIPCPPPPPNRIDRDDGSTTGRNPTGGQTPGTPTRG